MESWIINLLLNLGHPLVRWSPIKTSLEWENKFIAKVFIYFIYNCFGDLTWGCVIYSLSNVNLVFIIQYDFVEFDLCFSYKCPFLGFFWRGFQSNRVWTDNTWCLRTYRGFWWNSKKNNLFPSFKTFYLRLVNTFHLCSS